MLDVREIIDQLMQEQREISSDASKTDRIMAKPDKRDDPQASAQTPPEQSKEKSSAEFVASDLPDVQEGKIVAEKGSQSSVSGNDVPASNSAIADAGNKRRSKDSPADSGMDAPDQSDAPRSNALQDARETEDAPKAAAMGAASSGERSVSTEEYRLPGVLGGEDAPSIPVKQNEPERVAAGQFPLLNMATQGISSPGKASARKHKEADKSASSPAKELKPPSPLQHLGEEFHEWAGNLADGVTERLKEHATTAVKQLVSEYKVFAENKIQTAVNGAMQLIERRD